MAGTSLKDKKSVSPDLDTELVGNERGDQPLIMLETNSTDKMMSNARRQRYINPLGCELFKTSYNLWMALGDDARRKPTLYSRPALAQTTFYHFHIGMILRSEFLL